MVDAGRNTIANNKGISGTRLEPVGTLAGSLTDIVEQTLIEIDGKQIVNIHPVLQDDFYVFTQSFYENGADQSLLEILTRTYLNRDPIDPTLLLQVANTYTQFGGLERFYYIPIILALIKSTVLSF